MKRHRSQRDILPFLLSCLWVVVSLLPLNAQDTASRRQRQWLQTIVISQDHKPSPTLSQTPVQVVDIEKIERSGALFLSDALKQMAGVTLRDYGGIGGMKTVSARGLGSQFSTLSIDGVAVNDCQNGQVDLSRYLLGNSAYVSLSNGMQDEPLLSARSIAAGSIINMETQKPFFLPGQRTHTSLGFESGSFGMLSPTLSIQHRISKNLTLSFWGNYLRSNGDYPFTLYYTTSHNDSSSIERREHSAMWLATGDLNLQYSISNNKSLTTKVHYVQGSHELPGPVVFYAKTGSENTAEKLFFAQTRYREYHKNIRFQVVAKYQHTYDQYENFRAQTVTRYQMNEYSQDECYLSSTADWKPFDHTTLSITTDAAAATLHSNLTNNSEVTRLSSLSALSLRYHHERLDIKSNILATVVNENACDNPGTVNYRKLSPYAGISIQPLKNSPLRLRYFFKETYRVPNFNEMYYFILPLDTLRPECATQHNIGFSLPFATHYCKDSSSQYSYLLAVDVYQNNVDDKIIAVPRQNMFIWSTMNLGKVDIKGIDMKGNIDWQWKRRALSVTMTYSYQKAVDRSNPDNPKTYNHQIPYTPRHSGGVSLYYSSPLVNVGYTCMAVGERFSQQQNSDESRMPPYAEHGITLDRNFELRIGDIKIQFILNNIFNVQYEVVRSYPMMGRNFRIKATYST